MNHLWHYDSDLTFSPALTATRSRIDGGAFGLFLSEQPLDLSTLHAIGDPEKQLSKVQQILFVKELFHGAAFHCGMTPGGKLDLIDRSGLSRFDRFCV